MYALLCVVVCSLQYNGGKDMTSGSFTSTADIDFYIDVDANGNELVIVSDHITTRHQVGEAEPGCLFSYHTTFACAPRPAGCPCALQITRLCNMVLKAAQGLALERIEHWQTLSCAAQQLCAVVRYVLLT